MFKVHNPLSSKIILEGQEAYPVRENTDTGIQTQKEKTYGLRNPRSLSSVMYNGKDTKSAEEYHSHNCFYFSD